MAAMLIPASLAWAAPCQVAVKADSTPKYVSGWTSTYQARPAAPDGAATATVPATRVTEIDGRSYTLYVRQPILREPAAAAGESVYGPVAQASDRLNGPATVVVVPRIYPQYGRTNYVPVRIEPAPPAPSRLRCARPYGRFVPRHRLGRQPGPRVVRMP